MPRSGRSSGPTPGTRYTRPATGDDGGGGGGGSTGSGHGHHHHSTYYLGFGHHYYSPFYYSRFFYPYAPIYPYYGYGHYPYAYGSGYYPRARRSVYVEPEGALDLNVKPKDTQVYLDGYYIGTTGDYDGWPRYLWLDRDTHELIFYKEGYETVVREISVRVSEVINVKFRMKPGVATPPEELTTYKDRADRDREYASRYGGDDQGYDEREYRYRERRDDAARQAPTQPPREDVDLRGEAGRLVLTVRPPEASVYIDGRFVGIGGELSSLASGLLMDPGEHRIQVFHPEFETEEKAFEITAGSKTELGVELGSSP